MDSDEAEHRLAQIVTQPEVSDRLATVWTRYLSDGIEPPSWQQTLLDIWLRVDGNGILHDTSEDRERADNAMLADGE